MAPKRAPPANSSLYSIGSCDVVVEGKKFTCESGPKSLQISFSRNDNVKISVNEQMVSAGGKECTFLLLNPRDEDAFTKSHLQEVLKLYAKELPDMNFAANTKKQSKFLERCVLKGKFCTLILKSILSGASDEIIAAVTYQIVPADTQYAEIPLAAVTSLYQKKQFGKLVYEELRKRLQNVGVRAIFCWADKESEGFWFKQGFTSIAEVDEKGKASNLRIKANIRKALCFPGGSILMLSHLKREFPVNPEKLEGSTSRVYDSDCYNLLEPGGSPKPIERLGEDINHSSFSGGRDSVDSTTRKKNNVATEAAIDVANTNGCSTQGLKRTWEASLSSLQSKKIKGAHHRDCELYMDSSFHSARKNEQLSNGSSLRTFCEDPLNIISKKKDAEACRIPRKMTESLVNREPHPNGNHYRIMLMDIGDDDKRAYLTKVIENLSGVVTSEGSMSTHVVTGKVRRTLNFCAALCSGAWIVSPSWLKESFRQGSFANEASYMLHDEEYRLKNRTDLKSTVLRAKARPNSLLRGYDICIGTHVQQDIGTLSAIIQSAGGNVIRGMDEVSDASKTILIACEEDMESGVKGMRTFGCEWLMNCVMRQELDLEAPQFAVSL